MDSEKLVIAAVCIFLLSISMVAYSISSAKTIENRCNEHWLKQVEIQKKTDPEFSIEMFNKPLSNYTEVKE